MSLAPTYYYVAVSEKINGMSVLFPDFPDFKNDSKHDPNVNFRVALGEILQNHIDSLQSKGERVPSPMSLSEAVDSVNRYINKQNIQSEFDHIEMWLIDIHRF